MTKKHITTNDKGRAMDVPSVLTEKRLPIDDEEAANRKALYQLLIIRAKATVYSQS